MKNFKNRFAIEIALIALFFALAGLNKLVAQDCKYPLGYSINQNKSSNPLELIKKKFPKIYNVIINEAALQYPNDYYVQEHDIKMQSSAFGAFIIIMTEGDPSIPQNDLFDISFKSVGRNSKNFKNYSTPCENFQDYIKELDCMFSKMTVNWTNALNEITIKIEEYKSTHKNL
jgi:hypothetical protein